MNKQSPWQKLVDLFKPDDKQSVDNASDEVNARGEQRNWVVALLFLGIIFGGMYLFKLLSARQSSSAVTDQVVDYGEIITPDFAVKDTQSALQAQQKELLDHKKLMGKLQKSLESSNREIQQLRDSLEESQKRNRALINETLDVVKNASPKEVKASSDEQDQDIAIDFDQMGNSVNPFGYSLPPRASQGGQGNPFQTNPQNPQDNAFSPQGVSRGIDSFDFTWDASEKEQAYVRNVDNYVPSGSFVTAILTGGADANAGVYGQGDTAPIVFRTINEGFLPNGYKSRLKGCTVIASVYGEVSSSRGIVRARKLSCIFKNDEILDIPIRGTAFNFGRNGIRGTTVMRNGKIVQMAGVSGVFTGLGETAESMSNTVNETAFGSTSTVDPNKVLQSLGGSALKSVGSKLADYYIKLAEQYQPIVELNPGNIVNIVFLEGFPLDPDAIAAYELKMAQLDGLERQSQAGQILETITNPLIDQLPPQVREDAQNFNNITQSALGGAQ